VKRANGLAWVEMLSKQAGKPMATTVKIAKEVTNIQGSLETVKRQLAIRKKKQKKAKRGKKRR
jgi:hypothetical protein